MSDSDEIPTTEQSEPRDLTGLEPIFHSCERDEPCVAEQDNVGFTTLIWPENKPIVMKDVWATLILRDYDLSVNVDEMCKRTPGAARVLASAMRKWVFRGENDDEDVARAQKLYAFMHNCSVDFTRVEFAQKGATIADDVVERLVDMCGSKEAVKRFRAGLDGQREKSSRDVYLKVLTKYSFAVVYCVVEQHCGPGDPLLQSLAMFTTAIDLCFNDNFICHELLDCRAVMTRQKSREGGDHFVVAPDMPGVCLEPFIHSTDCTRCPCTPDNYAAVHHQPPGVCFKCAPACWAIWPPTSADAVGNGTESYLGYERKHRDPWSDSELLLTTGFTQTAPATFTVSNLTCDSLDGQKRCISLLPRRENEVEVRLWNTDQTGKAHVEVSSSFGVLLVHASYYAEDDDGKEELTNEHRFALFDAKTFRPLSEREYFNVGKRIGAAIVGRSAENKLVHVMFTEEGAGALWHKHTVGYMLQFNEETGEWQDDEKVALADVHCGVYQYSHMCVFERVEGHGAHNVNYRCAITHARSRLDQATTQTHSLLKIRWQRK